MWSLPKVTITVLKTLRHEDVFGRRLPEVSEDMPSVCRLHNEGEVYTVEVDGQKPVGFCTWAWHDIVPEVTTLRFGGSFPWMRREGTIIASCSDGAKPVIFKLERVS